MRPFRPGGMDEIDQVAAAVLGADQRLSTRPGAGAAEMSQFGNIVI